MKSIYLFLFLLLSSCSIYQNNFECPPDPGVPCTSVTDLEQMILETDEGSDIFLSTSLNQCTTSCKRKVWINACKTNEGCWVPGHYIYLD